MPFIVKDNPVPEFPRLTHFGICGDETERVIPPHVHLGYEIVYIETGHGEVIIREGDEPRRLDADDVMVTRPRIRHRFVVRGHDLSYIWFGMQTDPAVLQTPEHKMSSFPLLPPADIAADWLGEPMFRDIFERLGQDMSDNDYLLLHRVPEVARAFDQLKDEVTGHGSHRAALIYASLIEIFTRLSRRLENGSSSGRSAVLNRLVEYIQAHFNETLSLERLCEYSGYTPAYLSRLFSRETGTTVSRFIEDVRMKKARELLAAGHPVGKVSRDAGFSSSSYFSRRFAALHGRSPRAWRTS